MQQYFSRNSMAKSGLHFALNCNGIESKDINKNILPQTLKTSTEGPKGKLSVTCVFAKQYSRINSVFNIPNSKLLLPKYQALALLLQYRHWCNLIL